MQLEQASVHNFNWFLSSFRENYCFEYRDTVVYCDIFGSNIQYHF